MRLAIIDVGTNTINLAISVIKKDSYQIIYSSKESARMGKGGINDGLILPDAMERGMEAIGKHMKTIANFNVDKVVAIGTSVMRNATNSGEFVSKVKEAYGLDIKIVSGDDEAQLIYDGVKQVMPIGTDRVLILDIGGGSNEFILANKDGILWKHSFELGLSRLLDKFNISDPVTQPEIKAIEAYIRAELSPLYEVLHNYPTTTLIGTSGSFDTIASLIAGMKHPSMNVKLSTSYEITISNFEELHRKLIVSTTEQRKAMPCMDKARVELIIPGTIFINFIIREMRMERLSQCNYALKQGAVYQFINGQLG